MEETKKQTKKSQAKRIKILIKKTKGILWNKKNTVDFKEPIALLIRRSGKIEFYEKVTSGDFEYTHSNGRTNKILLSPEFLKTFDYGNKTFKGYILNEDCATPIPENPITSAELVSIAIDKTLHDVKTWKARELEAKGNLIWKIALGIALIITVIILYYMLVPQTPVVMTTLKNTSISVI